ncbi:MAG TPA: DUF3098 domain-containing protein [Bacteroidia bacterium]|jgi:hypothetical protein|nr:DUF3098 domain-containing protein [Bacteroidia bacterium]
MAVPKEVKKEIRTEKPKMQFAFDKKNYMILIGGIALLILGFILLSGGGSKDPNEFSDELFSKRRMVIAPIILMLGYITVAVAIMTKRDEHTASDDNQE